MCIGHTFYLIDKNTQLDNNWTYTVEYTKQPDVRMAHPILNFTKMISEELAYIPIDCFEFSIEWYFYWTNLFAQLDSNFNIFLQAFLLTQLENAKEYRQIISIIQ